MSTATPVLAWGWHGLTPTILLIKSKSTKSTLEPVLLSCFALEGSMLGTKLGHQLLMQINIKTGQISSSACLR